MNETPLEPTVALDAINEGVMLARQKCRDAMPDIIDRLVEIALHSDGRQSGVGVSAAKAIAQIAGALKDDKQAEKDGEDSLKKAVKSELAKLSPEQKRSMAGGLRKVV